ncbi:MAG: M14-type cytosolic carboxypeptidase [Myxococcota bacterium]
MSAAFDSGNIDVLDASRSDDVQLAIRRDAGGDHLQWFHFRVGGARNQPLRLRIVNAAECSYAKAWNGYQAVASTDRVHWFRVPTRYESGQLHIEHTPTADVTWYAYFAPFSWEQHQDLIGRTQQVEGVTVERLGATLDGHDLDVVHVGSGPRTVWAIARQHPGESMAEWWMQGFLRRLVDPRDALAGRLRDGATFHVVPNMNPDGSRRGHLRNNAAGANLNREWHAPTMERSPEVKLVRDRMDETGVDFCLDVHGDEELPYNFLAGPEGVPSYSERIATIQQRFLDAYIEANPDMQKTYGYPKAAPGQANLTMCSNQVAHRFDCLALTLEQPFKDTANRPQPDVGWSPGRAERLGASAIDAIAAILGQLR